MTELNDLGLKYRTDKSSEWHDYLDTYSKYLTPYKDKPINILEIGVSNGNSLKTWQDFFPNASVAGLDINPVCQQYEDSRIKVIIGDQGDNEFLGNVIKSIGEPTIIIEDGSHYQKHMISSFEFLWPHLADGGIYIIEDMHCCYLKDKFNPDNSKNFLTFLQERVNDVNLNGKCVNEDICGSRQRQYNRIKDKFNFTEYEKSIDAIHIHSSFCIIEKKNLEDK